MPSTRCLACRRRRPVERSQYGKTVQCRQCGATFRATAPPLDVFTATHPVGRLAGRLLLIAAAVAFTWPVLGVLLRGHRVLAEPDERVALFAAVGLAAVGWLLLLRWRRATDREELARAEAIARAERKLERFQ